MIFFFGSSLVFGGNLDICGRDAFFFALHLILGGNLEICGRDALFFCSSLDFGRKFGHLRFFCSLRDAQLHLCVLNDS